MDNYFISQEPFTKKKSSFIKSINKGIKFLRIGYSLQPLPDPSADMNSIEQRINYYLLLEGLIESNIEGDIIELGCFTGQCALLFQKVIEQKKSNKQLHLYDSFQSAFTHKGNIEESLLQNFDKAGLQKPVLHKGYFQDTLPEQLPEKISFAHIDCGYGGDATEHKNIILFCLENIYSRMSKGAICVLMDYHNSALDNIGWDVNPGVKPACDKFFSGKPEEIISLYGNQYSHAFFRKA